MFGSASFADGRGRPTVDTVTGPRRDAEPVRAAQRVMRHGRHHPRVVRQRLPIPMKTMLESHWRTRPGTATAAARTCSTIGGAEVAGEPALVRRTERHAIPQPACEEMYTVLRSG